MNIIKTLRDELKLTQDEFAKKIFKSLRTVINYEKSYSTIKEKELRLISQTFNVNLEWLKTGQGEIFKSNLQSNTIQKIVENLEKMSEDDRQEVLNFSIFKISDEKYSKKMRDNTA